LSYGVAEILVQRRMAEWAPGKSDEGTPLGQETPPASVNQQREANELPPLPPAMSDKEARRRKR
jgi:hypothetical protein